MSFSMVLFPTILASFRDNDLKSIFILFLSLLFVLSLFMSISKIESM